MAVQALEAGAHVLIEKPMALSVEDCDQIIDKARQVGRTAAVVHNQLYNPAFSRALGLVEQGIIGEVVGIRILLVTPTDYMTSQQAHWAHKLPGGVLGETGPHAVYLSLPWTGRIRETKVSTRKLLTAYPWSAAEDIRFDLLGEKGTGSITLLYGSPDTCALVEVFGSNGILKIDLQARNVAIFRRRGLGAPTVARSVLSEAGQMIRGVFSTGLRYSIGLNIDAHAAGIEQFLDHLERGRPFLSTAEEGREVVKVMEMLVSQIEQGAPEQR